MKKILIFALVFTFALQQPAKSYMAEDFTWLPHFLQAGEKPSVTIILDTSESMLLRFHDEPFDPAREFAGYWDPKSYYAYRPMSHGPCFVADNSSGEWNGNFLNWSTTTRMDVARMALTGGRFDDESECFVATGMQASAPAIHYDDSTPVTDLSGRLRFMTPHHHMLAISPLAASGAVRVQADSVEERMALRIMGTRRAGAIQTFEDRARMALFVFDGNRGGKLVQHMSDDPENFRNIIGSINSADVRPGSPLAETLHTVLGYLRQDVARDAEFGPRYSPDSYRPAETTDPFHFSDRSQLVPCTRQTVILVSDGVSSDDLGIPEEHRALVPRPRPEAEYDVSTDGSTYLLDIAYHGHTTDLRQDDGMEGMQSINLLTVSAMNRRNALLMDAARVGNFIDHNGLPDLPDEYDTDGDGNPDGYFQAETCLGLETAMAGAFQLATASEATGKPTGTALLAREAGGENVLYQAILFPPSPDAQAIPPWSGQIHAYFVDARGNLREDTNGDGRLSMTADRVIEFKGDSIFVHTDCDGDGSIDLSERNATALGSMLDIRFPWTTTSWLNSLSDSEAASQRYDYASPTRQRHIFTFVDKNHDMVPDAQEIQPFALADPPTALNNADQFFNYLTLYESRSGDIGLDASLPTQRAIDELRRDDPSAFNQFQSVLAKRQVDFIRGVNVENATICGIPDPVRSRTSEGVTWRLGDIVNSSPVVVGRPAENYHLIYGDKTYEAFVKKYANRRQVVYAGANDGMLHAFNAGFSGEGGSIFMTESESRPAFPLGMELWAYVPYNLLPHLKWLMHPDYGKKLHSAYMDLPPKVFDARIFFGPDGTTPLDSETYPHGWGTVLVAGMRMGGAAIHVDIDNTDGDAFNPEIDRTMTSAYVIMDITDPERPPILLAEIALPGQGFTTCRPAVMPMTSPDATTSEENQWYLVFGSGPASTTGEATASKLARTTSAQSGKLFVLDLKALCMERRVKTVDHSGESTTGLEPFATLEDASFVSEPVAVDLDIHRDSDHRSFKTDVVYFGTVSEDNSAPLGKVWRLRTGNSAPEDWSVSTLMDVAQPISAAPAVALDEDRRLWVYFGTGRLIDQKDTLQTGNMGFYGIREPEDEQGPTWETVQRSDLFDCTRLSVEFKEETDDSDQDICAEVEILPEPSVHSLDWATFKEQVSLAAGWRIEFADPGERVLSQASLQGETVIFKSYLANPDPCKKDGRSRLWALDYETGTPKCTAMLGTTGNRIEKFKEFFGTPIATPVIHVNEQANIIGYYETHAGVITTVSELRTERTESKMLFWEKNTE